MELPTGIKTRKTAVLFLVTNVWESSVRPSDPRGNLLIPNAFYYKPMTGGKNPKIMVQIKEPPWTVPNSGPFIKFTKKKMSYHKRTRPYKLLILLFIMAFAIGYFIAKNNG